MSLMLAVLPLLVSAVVAASLPFDARDSLAFPPTHGTNFNTHDPTIIKAGGLYYSYGVGEHILIYQAPSLDGPWDQVGTVLDEKSEIDKGDSESPWAPSILYSEGMYYCYYSVSNSGVRNSAIGVATSITPQGGLWRDHGKIVESGKGNGTDTSPFDRSNTIDPDVLIDNDGNPYLTFGSFWTGIWQIPLDERLVLANYSSTAEARHLVAEPHSSHPHPIEGPFIYYREPWYYLWFSHGKCCHFDPDSLPPSGDEYVITLEYVVTDRLT
jgi:arabinan endo-1,5-alpha-L-arabinosidase